MHLGLFFKFYGLWTNGKLINLSDWFTKTDSNCPVILQNISDFYTNHTKGAWCTCNAKLSWITRLSVTHKIYKSHLHLQVPITVTHQHWKPLPLRRDKDYKCMNLLLCTFSNHLVIKPGHHQSQHDSRVCQVTPTSNNQGNETLL